ncbi:Isochorismatase-like protein [Xylogone sp. PMI_703]|nr:Isochorismatase-like protein [Xylogone sp. PMI_703]
MAQNTALILIDPLNDFVHPEGKLYGLLKESIETSNAVPNLLRLIKKARQAHIPIFYCLHQGYQEGKFSGWKHMKKNHVMIQRDHVFEVGAWGGDVLEELKPDLKNGDTVVARHWNSNSFANTDLEYELRQHDITHVVCAGMVANTCIESTARHAGELGYTVTLIKDATAGFSNALKDAATDLIWPIIVEEVLTVDEWLSK